MTKYIWNKIYKALICWDGCGCSKRCYHWHTKGSWGRMMLWAVDNWMPGCHCCWLSLIFHFDWLETSYPLFCPQRWWFWMPVDVSEYGWFPVSRLKLTWWSQIHINYLERTFRVEVFRDYLWPLDSLFGGVYSFNVSCGTESISLCFDLHHMHLCKHIIVIYSNCLLKWSILSLHSNE